MIKQSFNLWQHRTIASSHFGGSFPPILRFEKFEIHTVFLRFSSLALTKNLSPNLLAELRSVALKLKPEDFAMKKTYQIEVDCANCANLMEDEKKTMKAVLKACRKVEPDCEIEL